MKNSMMNEPGRAVPIIGRQRGIVLVIALIVLVAMTLASVAMVRSVDTSTVIAGSLAFKQSAIASGDAAFEKALEWIQDNKALLESDSASNGYYATSQDSKDLTGNKTPDDSSDDIDWSSTGVVTLDKDASGNQMAYVIHRMCQKEGALAGADCATDTSEVGGSSIGGARQMLTYQQGKWSGLANVGYYRITVKVSGPKKSASYLQAIVKK